MPGQALPSEKLAARLAWLISRTNNSFCYSTVLLGKAEFSAALLWRSGTCSCFSGGAGKDSDEDEVLVFGWWVRPRRGCCRGCPLSPDPGFVGDILRGRGGFRRATRLPAVGCRDPVGLQLGCSRLCRERGKDGVPNGGPLSVGGDGAQHIWGALSCHPAS